MRRLALLFLGCLHLLFELCRLLERFVNARIVGRCFVYFKSLLSDLELRFVEDPNRVCTVATLVDAVFDALRKQDGTETFGLDFGFKLGNRAHSVFYGKKQGNFNR